MKKDEGNEIRDLANKLNILDKKIQEMSKQHVEYNITIHDLHISDPVLKELTFALEKLDIKELSGALNMGNNFAPKVEQGKKKKKQEKKKEEEKKKDDSNIEKKEKEDDHIDIVVKINDTPLNYTIS